MKLFINKNIVANARRVYFLFVHSWLFKTQTTMKTTYKLFIAVLLIGFSLSSNAQTPNYKHGNVWNVSFIKTKANMETEYLNSLKASWKAVMDEAVKQGLIVSFKILEGSYANNNDWNIMLMQEFKDANSMGDMNQDKWEAIFTKVIGGQDKMKATNESRVSIRDIFGDKMMSDIIYK
jgi:hypothetical protein